MLRLVIANKLYSSWSMRPWLVMRAFDIAFDETVIPLKRPETKDAIANVSPSGKVPLLIDGDVTVWESLAIIEYLAEKFPDKAIWPQDPKSRAHARAISNEMHGGFMALRQGCPMNLGKRFKTPGMSDDLKANVARVEEIWRDTRARFGTRTIAGGPYLFGQFSAADAMFAPVVARLDTYQIPVSSDSRAFMDAILSHPAFLEWKRAALAEPWTIADYETGHTATETFRETFR
jgi:glutathione S-transferase